MMREAVSNRENNEERGGLLLAKEPSQLTLPLGPDRTNTVRSMPSGSAWRTAQYVHRRVAV